MLNASNVGTSWRVMLNGWMQCCRSGETNGGVDGSRLELNGLEQSIYIGGI